MLTLDAAPGTTAVVLLSGDTDFRRRLMELGFTPGAEVCPLFSAPSGDPRAYYIRGTVIALRNADARRIGVSEA